MPRLVLTASESTLLGIVLMQEARSRGLSESDALVTAANTTTAELRTFIQTRLNALKASDQTLLSGADAANTARKSALSTEIATIDSVLTKVV